MAVNMLGNLKTALKKDRGPLILKIKLFIKVNLITINFMVKVRISGKTTVNMKAIG